MHPQSSAHNNSVRSVNGNSRKVTKKKKSKQQDHSFDMSTLAPLDTGKEASTLMVVSQSVYGDRDAIFVNSFLCFFIFNDYY